VYTRKIILSAVIVVLSFCIIFPLVQRIHSDEENFRYSVMSAVLHGRAILDGQYPLWTSFYGFGIPTPFLMNINYHPLYTPLLAWRTHIGIIAIYWVQMAVALTGAFLFSRKLGHPLPVAAVIALSYALSTDMINYLYTDFWVSAYIPATTFPFYMLALHDLMTDARPARTGFYALLLGLMLGFVGLNSYMPQHLIYGVVLGLVILANWRRLTLTRLYSLGLVLVVFLLIFSTKIYYFIDQLRYFHDTPFVTFGSPFGQHELWSIFLRPFIPAPQTITRYQPDSRVLALGLPFAIFALVGVLQQVARFVRRSNPPGLPSVFTLVAPLCVLVTIYTLRPNWIYSINSSTLNYRSPIVLFVGLIAGDVITRIKRPWMLGLVLGVQLFAVVLIFYPYWSTLPQQRQLADVLQRPAPAFVQQLRASVGQARLMLSDLANDVMINQMMSQGVSWNSLPYHDIRLVNGRFNGVSMGEICPDNSALYGQMMNCPVLDRQFYDVAGIVYFMGVDGQAPPSGMELVSSLGKTGEHELFLFENPTVWREATVVSDAIVDVALVNHASAVPAASGLVSQDLSAVVATYIQEQPNLYIEHHHGTIEITFATPTSDATRLFISEYYRPGWQAVVTTRPASIPLHTHPEKVLNAFMTLVVPSQTVHIQLYYRPPLQFFLEMLSLTSMTFMGIVAGVWWLRLPKSIPLSATVEQHHHPKDETN
jgi:hypothetical protein